MAGITDLPFRNLVSSFGAGLVVSEMVASQEMVQARPSARARADLGLDAENSMVQIAGRQAHWMAECAKMCAANGARLIDINMGCPAKKVTAGASGSALMKDADHAIRLIEAVVGAVDVPVTLKMRLGWDDDTLNAATIGTRAVGAGIKMLTVHGRTRCQFYRGHADWALIRPVVEAAGVPVIANGDIGCAQTARRALDLSGAAGVMVGRAVRGVPWKLREIADDLSGLRGHRPPNGAALGDVIEQHYTDMLAFYGLPLGLKTARKHLGWYMDRLAAPMGVRRQILTSTNPRQVVRLLRDLCERAIPEQDAA